MKILIGWSSKRALEPARVDSLLGNVVRRYQCLFDEALQIAACYGEKRGLACVGAGFEGNRDLCSSREHLVCFEGTPSISTPFSTKRGKLSAMELLTFVRSGGDASKRSPLINPPWSLYWYDKTADEFGCVTDGIGLSRVFVAESDGIVCYSNKCWPVIQLLEKSFSLDKAAWGHWFTQGWFPVNTTAFGNIRVLGPGEHHTYDASENRISETDCLSKWLSARNESDEPGLLAAATSGFSNFLELESPSKYCADLTGGVDSRAVCAALMRQTTRCKFVTGGSRFSDDVIIAAKIAKRLGLDWSRAEPVAKHMSVEAAIEDAAIRFERMTLWDEGNVEPNRFEHFPIAGLRRNSGISVNGGGSEISRGHYYPHSIKDGVDHIGADAISRYHSHVESKARSILTKSEPMMSLFEKGLNAGMRNQLAGLELLDFYYLNERIRRWFQAHLSLNPATKTWSPFINVDHIKLAFSMDPLDKSRSKYQFHLIRSLCPELLSIPINQQIDRSCFWRWRKLPYVSDLIRPGSTRRLTARVSQHFLKNQLPPDSPIFDIVKSDKLTERFNEFAQTSFKQHFFVLRVMAFEAWRKQFC